MPGNATEKDVAARVEELLREQIEELGDGPEAFEPHMLKQNMRCEVFPDKSMVYAWKDIPILRVVPETLNGSVHWRMFTRSEDE